MNQWLRDTRNLVRTKELWPILKTKISGHYQYYGVSENFKAIDKFYRKVEELVLKWLNRRSQKKSFTWAQYKSYLKRYPLPKPYIVHSFYTWPHVG